MAVRRLCSDAPAPVDVESAGAVFPRSASQAIVRTLCHLLRLFALSVSGNADADSPCRSNRGLADRRRYSRSRRSAPQDCGSQRRQVSDGHRCCGNPLRSGQRRVRRSASQWRANQGKCGDLQCRSQCDCTGQIRWTGTQRSQTARCEQTLPICLGLVRSRKDIRVRSVASQRVFLAGLLSRVRTDRCGPAAQ